VRAELDELATVRDGEDVGRRRPVRRSRRGGRRDRRAARGKEQGDDPGPHGLRDASVSEAARGGRGSGAPKPPLRRGPARSRNRGDEGRSARGALSRKEDAGAARRRHAARMSVRHGVHRSRPGAFTSSTPKIGAVPSPEEWTRQQHAPRVGREACSPDPAAGSASRCGCKGPSKPARPSGAHDHPKGPGTGRRHGRNPDVGPHRRPAAGLGLTADCGIEYPPPPSGALNPGLPAPTTGAYVNLGPPQANPWTPGLTTGTATSAGPTAIDDLKATPRPLCPPGWEFDYWWQSCWPKGGPRRTNRPPGKPLVACVPVPARPELPGD
jgi:hypothetical protein